jgi:hypothetical protein
VLVESVFALFVNSGHACRLLIMRVEYSKRPVGRKENRLKPRCRLTGGETGIRVAGSAHSHPASCTASLAAMCERTAGLRALPSNARRPRLLAPSRPQGPWEPRRTGVGGSAAGGRHGHALRPPRPPHLPVMFLSLRPSGPAGRIERSTDNALAGRSEKISTGVAPPPGVSPTPGEPASPRSPEPPSFLLSPPLLRA